MDEFIKNLNPMQTGILGEIQLEAIKNNVPIISNDTARFISEFLSFLKPKKILEIGCAVGFSTGLMAKFLKNDGYIVTIERSDKMFEMAKLNFERLKITKKVKLIYGDASEILPNLNQKFDFIFLDAAKGQYVNFLPDCIRLLNQNGIMIADDIFQNGRIFQNRFDIPRRQRTIQSRLKSFIEKVFNDPKLESSVFTIGDGIILTRKLEN